MMNKEERIKITVNEEDVQNIIDCYEKDIEHIKELEQRINTYENPEDLTLMFMYCDEKAKDKIKDLQQRIDKAIECIKDFEIQANHINDEIYLDETLSNKLLEILGGKE